MRTLYVLGSTFFVLVLSCAFGGCIVPRYQPIWNGAPYYGYGYPAYYGGGGLIYPQTFGGGRPVYFSPSGGYSLSPGFIPPVYYASPSYAPGWGGGWQGGCCGRRWR